MRKLTYAIALSTLLLAGCSQDEGIMESKGELVTLNYKVSLGKDVQSRADASDLVVNKLLCVVFEKQNDNYVEIKRDTVAVENGQATYTPQLFTSITYNIVFWAFYQNGEKACFNLTDATNITANDNYNADGFTEDIHKDAYTQVDTLNLSQQLQELSVKLTRPFAQVNVVSSKTDYDKAVEYGRTPTTCDVKISGYANVYNALTKTWSGTASETILTSNVVTDTENCYYVSEYVFGTGSPSSCIVTVNDEEGEKIYTSEVPNLPLEGNKRTNMISENLLTGGGVTYTITVGEGFHENEHNKEI